MSDEQPIQNVPEDESKKDTVRINLPQGAPGKPVGHSPTPTVRLKPPAPPSGAPPAEDESKKETAVMGMPATTPKPKKDTSRVQVPAAKPGIPEMPRPTVKLKREEAPPVPAAASSAIQAPVAAPPPQPAAAPKSTAVPVASSGSAFDTVLAIAAMLVALAVAGYLMMLNNG